MKLRIKQMETGSYLGNNIVFESPGGMSISFKLNKDLQAKINELVITELKEELENAFNEAINGNGDKFHELGVDKTKAINE